jgi:hypothetical protein
VIFTDVIQPVHPGTLKGLKGESHISSRNHYVRRNNNMLAVVNSLLPKAAKLFEELSTFS